MLSNLTGQRSGLLDKIATVTSSQLQFLIRRLQLKLAQSKASHGGSVLSKQVRFVGLIAWISRHPILLGGKGIHDAGFKAGAGKGSLRWQVIVPRPLDDDYEVLNVVLLLDLVNLFDGQFEPRSYVLQNLGFDEDVAKVIGHHPRGAMFGWIDANDGEMLSSHLLNTKANDTIWFLQRFDSARL